MTQHYEKERQSLTEWTDRIINQVVKLDVIQQVGRRPNRPSVLRSAFEHDTKDFLLPHPPLKHYIQAWDYYNGIDSTTPKMAILQISRTSDRSLRFNNFERMGSVLDGPISSDLYEPVFIENRSIPEHQHLHQLPYEMVRFSGMSQHPENYYGTSLSVGDVIVFMDSSSSGHSYYVDSIGFQKLPASFLTNKMKDKIRLNLDIKEEYSIYNEVLSFAEKHHLKSLQEVLLKNERANALREGYSDLFELKEQAANTMQYLFVDMDGTLAKFTPVKAIEDLLQPGYFSSLEPISKVLSAVKSIVKERPDIKVNILSSVLSDSPYAIEEKNAWLDEHLPEIDKTHRYFPPCGADKKEAIPAGINPRNCFLLDDFTKNLVTWESPATGATGIKLLNGINHTRGTWQGNRISAFNHPGAIAQNIIKIMDGEVVRENIHTDRSLTHTAPMDPRKASERVGKQQAATHKSRFLRGPKGFDR